MPQAMRKQISSVFFAPFIVVLHHLGEFVNVSVLALPQSLLRDTESSTPDTQINPHQHSPFVSMSTISVVITPSSVIRYFTFVFAVSNRQSVSSLNEVSQRVSHCSQLSIVTPSVAVFEAFYPEENLDDFF